MKKFFILIPLYNDWESVTKLLNQIDSITTNWNAEVSVIIVNDASTDTKSKFNNSFKKIKLVKILNMKVNRVHQRCIATGLKYIYQNEDFDRIIIMDADGEDRPEELDLFFKKSEENPDMTITGNRFKRSEGLIFKILYEIHKILTLIFTGKLIKFGNFTCLPKNHVKKLIQKAYLWNSYSSSVVRTINERTSIPSIRGTRYVLPSKMNFSSLIFHSLSIISVFREQVVIRSIVFSLIYLFFNLNIFYPIIFLLIFVLLILKISMRANMDELEKSLDNIGNIDILVSSDHR